MAKPTIFAALLALAAAVGAIAWLGQDRPDGVPSRVLAPQAFVKTVRPERERCVPYQIVPPGTKAIQLTLGTFGRPVPASVALRATGNGRDLFSGRRRFREAQNVNIPIAPVPRREEVAEICVANTGRYAFQVAGQPGVGLSVRFVGSTRSTWAGSAGAIAERFSVARVAPLGAGSLWVALALALLALALALFAIIRQGSRQ